MNHDTEEQQAPPAGTTVETLYLDARGQAVPPELALRVIVNILDDKGNIIKSTLFYNPTD